MEVAGGWNTRCGRGRRGVDPGGESKPIEDSGAPIASTGAQRVPSMMAEMDVEADGPFVVFPTSDPDIAVVWLLNPKESD